MGWRSEGKESGKNRRKDKVSSDGRCCTLPGCEVALDVTYLTSLDSVSNEVTTKARKLQYPDKMMTVMN